MPKILECEAKKQSKCQNLAKILSCVPIFAPMPRTTDFEAFEARGFEVWLFEAGFFEVGLF